jgi:hypothetical protein
MALPGSRIEEKAPCEDISREVFLALPGDMVFL